MLEKLSIFFKSEYGQGFRTGIQFTICFFVVLFNLSSCWDRYNGSGVDAALEGAGANQRDANSEIGNAQRKGEAAQEAISGAGSRAAKVQERIDRSIELAGQGSAGLDLVASELEECTKLAKKSQRLISETIQGN